MTALSTASHAIALPTPRADAGLAVAPGARFAVGLWAFLCCMPYPALTIGNRSALQAGDLMSLLLLLVPCVAVGMRGRVLREYLLLLIPMAVSAYSLLFRFEGVEPMLCLKSIIVWAVPAATMVVTIAYCHKYRDEILTGIALATLAHGAVGAWQYVSFLSGEFPLLWLYTNPSFLSVENNATTIARYVQRPFGLFPEPSAMSASLSPWVVLFLAMSAGLMGEMPRVSPLQRTLYALASLVGLALILVSRSGQTIALLPGLAAMAGVWLWRAPATRRSYVILLLIFLAVAPLAAWASTQSLGTRLSGAGKLGNSSWDDRSASLRIGYDFVANAGPATAFLGMGPGQSSPAMQRTARLEAVWSVLLIYVYETGLIGALACIWIAGQLACVWREAATKTVFVAMTLVWFVGITLATSYQQLLPIWLTLGWLLEWPHEERRAGR